MRIIRTTAKCVAVTDRVRCTDGEIRRVKSTTVLVDDRTKTLHFKDGKQKCGWDDKIEVVL